jgi:hypothetical protein
MQPVISGRWKSGLGDFKRSVTDSKVASVNKKREERTTLDSPALTQASASPKTVRVRSSSSSSSSVAARERERREEGSKLKLPPYERRETYSIETLCTASSSLPTTAKPNQALKAAVLPRRSPEGAWLAGDVNRDGYTSGEARTFLPDASQIHPPTTGTQSERREEPPTRSD